GSAAPTAVSANPASDRQAGESTGRSSGKPPEALLGKTIVGYQGWFGCPGEPGSTPGAARWRHWFAGQVDQAPYLTVEMLPDISGLESSALCVTNLRREDGSPVSVFSSVNPAVV